MWLNKGLPSAEKSSSKSNFYHEEILLHKVVFICSKNQLIYHQYRIYITHEDYTIYRINEPHSALSTTQSYCQASTLAMLGRLKNQYTYNTAKVFILHAVYNHHCSLVIFILNKEYELMYQESEKSTIGVPYLNTILHLASIW